jgi:hypothetical protein
LIVVETGKIYQPRGRADVPETSATGGGFAHRLQGGALTKPLNRRPRALEAKDGRRMKNRGSTPDVNH